MDPFAWSTPPRLATRFEEWCQSLRLRPDAAGAWEMYEMTEHLFAELDRIEQDGVAPDAA